MEPTDQPLIVKKQSFFQWLISAPLTRQKMYILGGILGGALIITGLSFWLGFRNQSIEDAAMPTPTVAPTTMLEPTPSETPPPTSTPTPTKKPSPTPTKTPTPTPTSTPTNTPTPTPVSQTTNISATISLDGFQSTNGGGNADDDVRAGRNTTLVTRGFVSFSLSSIPSGATIEQATLRMYQTSVEGDPYAAGGDLKVDHLDYGESLENSDYGISALSTSFATLSNSSSVSWKELDVTDRVRDDKQNSRNKSQYRFHFSTEATGGVSDFAHFESAENNHGTGNMPQLSVRYH